MPSIFRKRFLRTGDVLDPEEMNEDFQPWTELLAGNLTAHNLNAVDFAANAELDKDAHVRHDYAEVICALPFLKERPIADRQPNFLKQPINAYDGGPTEESLRNAYKLLDAGSPITFDFIPENVQVIAKGGGWTAMSNGKKLVDFSVGDGATYETVSSSVTTVSDGEVDLWINGFVQYLRNGFGRTFDAFLDPSMSIATGYAGIQGNPELGGYREDSNTRGVRFVPTLQMEQTDPSRAACSHVSMGYDPADVQFAIRVDGQILEETITGKRNIHSRVPLGMRNIESRAVDNDAVHYNSSDGKSAPSGGSINQKMPGNRVPTVRAAGLGPEVFGTRLGTVVRVGAGSHKIEIVARRLANVEGFHNFPNDVVGVFNRQLSVTSISRDRKSTISTKPTNMPAFDTEDPLELRQPTRALEFMSNDIPASAVMPNSLRHQHLSSIVRNYAYKAGKPVGILTKVIPQIEDGKGWLTMSSLNSRDLGGLNVTESPILSSEEGWQALRLSESADSFLMVSNSDGTTTSGEIGDNDLMYVFVDLVCNIRPQGNMPMKNRMLDSFAHFCIAHREYNSEIGDASKSKTWRFDRASRVTVNLNNWTYRGINYNMTQSRPDHRDYSTSTTGYASTYSKDRRVRYEGLENKNDDSIHVSLVFVLDGSDKKRRPPGTSGSYAEPWEIGDIAVFCAGSQSGGTLDGKRHDGSKSDNWHDVYWERGATAVSDASFRADYYDFQWGYDIFHTCSTPLVEFNAGVATISLLRLNRSTSS